MTQIAAGNTRKIFGFVKLAVEEASFLVFKPFHRVGVKAPAFIAFQLVGAKQNVVIDIFASADCWIVLKGFVGRAVALGAVCFAQAQHLVGHGVIQRAGERQDMFDFGCRADGHLE